jgi:SH3-like domain-containing protein
VPAAAAPAALAGMAPDSPTVGAETNLPLPRFVSLKTDEGNARRGPALDQRIDWVFVREDMPLLITAEHGHWRRVEDREGLGGWVHYSLLSGSRTVIVAEDRLPLRASPEDGAQEIALLERDVVARLETCEPQWCRLSAGGYGGWAPKAALWGVGAEEVLD